MQLLLCSQLAVQLMGQGMVLLQGVDRRVVPFVIGQLLPPAVCAQAGVQTQCQSSPDKQQHMSQA